MKLATTNTAGSNTVGYQRTTNAASGEERLPGFGFKLCIPDRDTALSHSILRSRQGWDDQTVTSGPQGKNSNESQ
jgi:hypothetical protein